MIQLRMLYDCDHKIITRKNVIDTFTITKTNSVDVIPVNNIITIIEVTQVINGKRVTLSPEIYYIAKQNIVWQIPQSPEFTGKYRVPSIGESYDVKLKYMEVNLNIYNITNCPRCKGNGWFLDIYKDMDGVNKVQGPYLVAQEFIKCLLTIPGTDRLDNQYGSGLLAETGVMYLDDSLINEINTAVNNAEMQCKKIQASDYNRSLNEILDRVIVDSIEVDKDISGVYIYLTLLTAAGNQIKFNVAI